MKKYRHVLLATDLVDDAGTVAKRAADMAEMLGADLSMIHVVEPLPGYGYAFIAPNEIENELVIEAKKQLAKLGKKHGVPEDRQVVLVGPTKTEILECADDVKADLIIVGSHGRHGLGILLGSTANAVIQGAKCDVFTVRVGKKD
jgi:universal stress protein A